ncbi:hypothetical protein SAMN05443665_1009166 [Actinomadura meyerae]|jgi:hypothetical protein|uniref:Secreted protein n=1 Tax=Actinomadura meyerae TaxID=240840 RepID=A0A239HGQ1_9ACTN|nr:hypothetical protein [Actinomadura meyerae]SNS80537.1 hypothetical protein SAMN05443665_1009166 [Actinomadura meyerae]
MPSRKTAAVALAMATTASCLALAGAASAESTQTPVKPAAPRAAALPPGYQIVTLPNANVPNFQRRTVYCPGGKHVLGGGGEAQGNGAILVGSFPTPDGRGWIALGRQIGYNDVGISVYAICAD